MKIDNLNDTLESGIESLKNMINKIISSEELDTTLLKKENTALVIVDMVNGFAKKGNLMSSRINNIIPSVLNTTNICYKRGFKILAFNDEHSLNSIEFNEYPVHCLKETWESELIDELKKFEDIKIIGKNSTNGFIEEEFKSWMSLNNHINNFIVVGNCTDICVMQFVMTLKSYFNKKDEEVSIFLPMDSVETFHSKEHNGDLMNIFAMYNMSINGVQIMSNIK
ncbi:MULTISPECIES: isochorismatase family cysteine hydrolase [Clostridium]|uniref:Probable pyrazinamidase/nicotinamidase n=1 Tax=Clostridium novyi (strain NT) TaxID=386415 RepID=A0Q1B2_CLONN|nr:MULTISPECIES: isochorismatase family cysteine hydrolase [Clostridium]ABK61878.1 probable pyrazinamidase/nicotinamidase [Clostridium novyi NT]KEH85250.1 isochorismatase [Clostridium novyi A str. NCTC 538]KEH86734.1 isochorismatase [Clostridium novyi A str. BKT29909]KEH92279.1 isochorismatase [Clostridium botulinum C/D str. It1]